MKKNKRLCILLTLYFSIGQIDAQTPLSFEESLHLLNQGNQSLKIADKSIEIAKYNPQIEMFARFKMKSSFHKTKRII